MIRYIAVTAVKDGEEVIHIPETLIENISKIDNGRAEIVYRELREDDTSEAYSSTTDWRITGYASEKAYSVMKFDDLIAWLNGIPRPLMLDISPEEARHIKATLEGTRRTLDSITTPAPRQQIGIESDVLAIIQLLKDREWAEHCTTTELGGELEAEITALVGTENEAAGRLKRAESLLRTVHELVSNGGMVPIDDSQTLNAIADFLRK